MTLTATNSNSFLVNHKEVFEDNAGCIIARQPLTTEEAVAVSKHQQEELTPKHSKMQKSENRITVEIIRYYQQLEALKPKKQEYINLKNAEGYTSLLRFYHEKIQTLRKQLDEINPDRLQEIDTQRANDCTIKGDIEVGS